MIVDLFAGPGGWSEGLRMVGRSDVGIEWDRDACATRAAAGHATVRADVGSYPVDHLAGRVEGLIASPPCPAFSAAGKGAGRDVAGVIVGAVRRRDWFALRNSSPEVWLTLDVGRWIKATRPEWVALEQVPPVLPIWEAFAEMLRADGYWASTAVVSAERWGVPQTRRRAVLVASRVRPVSLPQPTHQAYVPGVPQGDPEACSGLLGELAPWVSMADALGWGLPGRPAPTVSGGGARAGGAEPFANSAMRRRMALHTNRDQRPDGSRQVVEVDRPAPALTTKAGGQWVWDRPATTVQGDPRLAGPGHRDRAGGQRQFDGDAVRISVAEALAWQSFRADYPVQGTKTSRFRQVGNAVPPLLARAVLAEVLS